MSRFGLSIGGDVEYDPIDAFEPAHLPTPGPFLLDHEVLTGPDHTAFHALTADCFDARGVYDATFGYNLARLNRDPRHPDAGFRYARERGDPAVLRAEFTPTTPFCPQSRSLTVGAFRAWNGRSDRHEYDRVRVRVHPMHDESLRINAELKRLENGEQDD